MKKYLPLGLFLLIVILLWRGLGLHPNLIPSPLINKPVPTSRSVFLGQVTLLNVFASWCEACAEEQGFLNQLAKNNKVRIIGFNYKDTPLKAKAWLKQYGNPYQNIMVDSKGETAIDWGIYGTPETFVIDKKGIIRYKVLGAISPDLWEETLGPLILKLESETL